MTGFYRPFLLFVVFLLFSSCNKISEGEQREKLQYLYGLKLQLTLLMDESYYLNSAGRLNSYKQDTRNIRNTVESSTPLEGWEDGRNFKNRFLELIDSNLSTTDSMLAVKDSVDFNTNHTLDYMRSRENDLMEELDALISKVGREK